MGQTHSIDIARDLLSPCTPEERDVNRKAILLMSALQRSAMSIEHDMSLIPALQRSAMSIELDMSLIPALQRSAMSIERQSS